MARPPIHIDWDEEALGVPNFKTGAYNLFGPHLSRPSPGGKGGETVSDIRLAVAFGVAPSDIELLDLRTGETIPTRVVDAFSAEARQAPFATGAALGEDVGPPRDYQDQEAGAGGAALPAGHGGCRVTSYRAFDGLQRGAFPGYAIRLSPAGQRDLEPQSGSRRAIPYRWIARDGHMTRPEVDRLSHAFYSRVFQNREPASFSAAFVESAGTVEEAARTQASWFFRYFGGLDCGGNGPYDFHDPAQQRAAGRGAGIKGAGSKGEDLDRVGKREGFLGGSLVAKHPDMIMTLEHALLWLKHMGDTVQEIFPGEERAALRRSILLFSLHFLGFFPFTEAELCQMYERASPLLVASGPGTGAETAEVAALTVAAGPSNIILPAATASKL